ncbi:MAG: sigma-70 family RNA polymerase sigma factor [Lachnospiraceae bacterium]|nr:sigma-70 family RNA polymerase sigma factor [Lachnospiraceae bacterium]
MQHLDYEQITEKYIDTVYRIAISYTKTQADADDVVQQTFLKLLTKNVVFADEEHVKRWLIRVCVNECNSLFSSFWRKNVISMEEAGGPEQILGELQFESRQHSDLFDAIRSLSPKLRVVIYLFYYEGYATKDIAEILHMKEATVRTRLVSARKILKEQLKEAWEDE